MGAGDFSSGAGGAGLDPVYLPAPVSAVLPPRAVKYDPFVKQYLLTDANGNAIDVHPIAQIVAMRLTTERGVSASSPDLGTRIRRRFDAAAPTRHKQIAYDEVRATLADLIAAGDILFVGVTVTTDAFSRTIVTASYVNLRDPDVDQRYPLQSAVTAPSVSI